MRKKAILAFMLAAAMVLTGCALVEKDMAVDNATVIVQLGDKTVTKEQVNYALDDQLQSQAEEYSSFGYSLDITDETVRDSALDTTLDSLASQLVRVQKAEELGFNTITDEEDAKIRETAQSGLDYYKEIVKYSYFSDTALEGDELDKAISDKLTELGLTFDMFYDNEKVNAQLDKLRESVVSGITVTDEEIQADFDSKVESAKANYASNLSSYGSAVNYGSTVYYAPAGYRYVKHILRIIPDETQTALSDLQKQISDKASEVAGTDASISALGEDVAEDAPERVELNDKKAAQVQKQADLQAQYDKALEDAYVQLQPTVDEILTKLTDGEDFDTLMETYGEDPGMKSSPLKETGYAVCEGFASFDPAFTQAAMALENVGDVSPAVRGQSGIHIIKYVSDIAEGPVALDTVKEGIFSSLLQTKQNDAYSAQVDEWVKESGVKIYKDRMK